MTVKVKNQRKRLTKSKSVKHAVMMRLDVEDYMKSVLTKDIKDNTTTDFSGK